MNGSNSEKRKQLSSDEDLVQDASGLCESGVTETHEPELAEEVYNELRRLAQSWLNKLPPGQTLNATSLVHEAYLRLGGDGKDSGQWEGRAHFFNTAAQTMRRILVDQARRKGRLKHGAAWVRHSLNGNINTDEPTPATLAEQNEEVLIVDGAIDKLKLEYPRQGEVVMLHYFAGLSHQQIAELLQVTTRTIERDWRFAKAWLRKSLGRSTH